MPIDGWAPENDADIIDFDDNKKDGTSALYGIEPDQAEAEPAPQQPIVEATDEDNALTAVIDIGLDMVTDICADIGYPKPKREIWENHGKSAMNKAVNTLCPAGTGGGNMINSPWIGLVIGIGCLFLCLYPIISYKLKMQDNAKPKEVELAPDTKQISPASSPTQTKDNNADVQVPVKLPGGDPSSSPNISAAELLRRNLEAGGEPAII